MRMVIIKGCRWRRSKSGRCRYGAKESPSPQSRVVRGHSHATPWCRQGTECCAPRRGAVGMVDDQIEGVAQRVPQRGGHGIGLDLVRCLAGLPGVDDRLGLSHERCCGRVRVVPCDSGAVTNASLSAR